MKKFKVIALMLVFVLSFQAVAFAADIQPRGAYLQGGGCSISPNYGYVVVGGHTDAFDSVDKLTITLTLFKETSPGYFVEIWSDSKTAYDDFEVTYTNTRVNVESGYRYMLEATHTVKHNNVTETNYSEAGPALVS